MAHKCFRCGTEFEGNFCPECGTKWEEGKTCPQCGAALPGNAKFCNECGYSFLKPAPSSQVPAGSAPTTPARASRPASPQKSGKGLLTLYTVSRFLPAVLLAVFSVLLFLLCLAPAAVMPGGELFGETIPSESLGSVYEMLSGEIVPSLKGCCVSLIVFASLMVAVSAGVLFYREKRAVACYVLGYAFLFAVFIVSCAMFVIIGKEDEGMGMLAAGSAPILILVFSLLFGLLAAAALGIQLYAKKSRPEILESYRSTHKTSREKKEERLQKFFATHPVPVEPEKMEKPKKLIPREAVSGEQHSELLLEMASYIRRKRSLWGVWLLAFSLFVPMISFFYSHMADSKIEALPFILGLGLPLVIIAIGVLIWSKNGNMKKLDTWKAYKFHIVLFIIITIVMAYFYVGVVVGSEINHLLAIGSSSTMPWNETAYNSSLHRVIGYSITAIAGLILLIICVCLLVPLLKQRKRLYSKLFGTKNPKNGGSLNESYRRDLIEYKNQYAKYEQNRRDWNIYRYELARYRKGKPYYANTKYSRVWSYNHKWWLTGGAVLLAGAITLTCILATMDRRFSIDNLMEIGLGAHETEVVEVLGEPDKKSETEWYYYSKDYVSLMEDMRELEEQSMNANSLEELAKLEQEYEELEKELATLEYKKIVVRFASQHGSVNSLTLDTCATEGNAKEKEAEEVTVSGRYRLGWTPLPFYTVSYTDGSYRMGYFTSSQLPTTAGDDQEITWSDEWGTYTATIDVYK